MSEKAKGSQIDISGSPLPTVLNTMQQDIDTKAASSYVDTELAKKSDTEFVNSQLLLKADSSSVALALATKADASALAGLASETYVNNAVSSKADASALHGLASETYVDNAVSTKADSIAVANALDTKADASAVSSALEDKADASALSALDSAVVKKAELKQTTGGSEDTPMSQKAVTQAIAAGVGEDLVREAPEDGKQYARKDGAWEEVVASGGGDSSVDVYVPLEDLGGLLELEEHPTDFSPIEWMLNLRDGMSNVLGNPEEFDGQSALYAPVIINKSSKEYVEGGDTKQDVFIKVTVLTSEFVGKVWESLYFVSRNITTGVDEWNAGSYQVPLAGDVEEAPIDGKQYARKDGDWEEVAAGGGGVQPLDGDYFLEVLAMSEDSNLDMADYPLVAALPYGSYNLEKEPALPDMVIGTGKLTILDFMGQKTIRYLIQVDNPADSVESLKLATGIKVINSSGIETEGYNRDIRSS